MKEKDWSRLVDEEREGSRLVDEGKGVQGWWMKRGV